MKEEIKDYKFSLLLDIERLLELTNSGKDDSPLLYDLATQIVKEIAEYEQQEEREDV